MATSESVYQRIGRLLRLGRSKPASRVAREALAESPDDLKLRILEAVAAFRAGERTGDEIRPLLAQLDEDPPTEAPIRQNVALLRGTLGDVERAVSELEELAADPALAGPCHISMAAFLFPTDRPRAEELIRTAVTLDPPWDVMPADALNYTVVETRTRDRDRIRSAEARLPTRLRWAWYIGCSKRYFLVPFFVVGFTATALGYPVGSTFLVPVAVASLLSWIEIARARASWVNCANAQLWASVVPLALAYGLENGGLFGLVFVANIGVVVWLAKGVGPNIRRDGRVGTPLRIFQI